MTIFWTKQRVRAAQLVADDDLPDVQIAAAVGRSKKWLEEQKLHPEFHARVVAIVAETAAALKNKGIVERQNRIDAYNDRWERMQRIIAERSVAMADDAPGGATGLLVRLSRTLGRGPDTQIVEEYSVDTALLAELRATERQAAQELDQWAERRELTGKNGGPIKAELSWLELVEKAAEE